MNLYLITIGNEYIRDTEIWTGEPPVGEDVGEYEQEIRWMDFYPVHYVGVFYAKDKDHALNMARERSKTSPEMTDLEDIDDDAFYIRCIEDEVIGIDNHNEKDQIHLCLKCRHKGE